MQALVRERYGSPEVLRVAEIDTPVPGDHQVLVAVHAASLNTADLEQMKGRPFVARFATGLTRPKSPRLGLDMAGEVEAVGERVTRFSPGDRVWGDLFAAGSGAMAEYVCVEEKALVPLPDGITFEEAATVPHSGILALQALRAKGSLPPGAKVLVNGAGGCVGPFAIQLAKRWGAEVTAVDHTRKLELMRSVGADHVVDYTEEDVTRSGLRYHLILDIAANRTVLPFIRALTPGGAYVQVARSLAGFLQAALLGAVISLLSDKRVGVFSWRPNRREDLDMLGGLLQGGHLVPVVDGTYPLTDAPQAVRRLEEGRASGKVVLTVR